MKSTILIFLLFSATQVFAQEEKVNNDISAIQDNIAQQQQEITALKQTLNNQETVINRQKHSWIIYLQKLKIRKIKLTV